MLLTDQNPFNKSIMISLLGRPNAGKSSLVNYLLGFDLTIVSNKPQTTRNQFHCAFTVDHTEIILVDTPGIHQSGQELNKRMNGQADFAAEGVDLNFLLLDLKFDPVKDAKDIVSNLANDLSATWIIFTKNDLVTKTKEELDEVFIEIQKVIPNAQRYYSISSTEGTNVHHLTGDICDVAKDGPHLYPNGEVSNKNERFFASEYIREQAFHILKDELPYEVAVVIEEFKDVKKDEENKKELINHISASILVNRPSQRAIVVGRAGTVIKQIGMNARKKIEAMVGGKVHLNLHVKVSPKWFKNNYVLEEIGLPRVQDSARVWRQK
ncbi:GTPase Era [Bacteriovoracaceae bacterium]|nr:GTPase Era [Bacteriovoracaceae bacterium]